MQPQKAKRDQTGALLGTPAHVLVGNPGPVTISSPTTTAFMQPNTPYIY